MRSLLNTKSKVSGSQISHRSKHQSSVAGMSRMGGYNSKGGARLTEKMMTIMRKDIEKKFKKTIEEVKAMLSD